jgi:hypothetical protein
LENLPRNSTSFSVSRQKFNRPPECFLLRTLKSYIQHLLYRRFKLSDLVH